VRANERRTNTEVGDGDDYYHNTVVEELPLAAKVAQPLQKD
jgi:hypothetical protein